MTSTEPRHAILDELSRVSRKMRALFDARVKERGLTLARARTLLILSRRGALTQRELADELDIETPTLVRLLDGMETQGFIERRSVEGDRRAKQIVMTNHGQSVAAEVSQLASELRTDVLKGISAEEMAAALGVLQKMTENVQAADRTLV
ncbi:MarR family transcriptional regulator [Sinorhizobium sp. BG8]|uniref:MarR family winged helix-turn-helix transcriptional regulator n=1 Tax=Sinorhizobium sp. BG8 TaxID=2613773 RepID=UPI00193E5DDC|nr:MarR family transcriptional regulator [Sinorhizobium sp. BG8]QRM54856.1 MarR family transcriptional regulator [Sinorhizobium sp. BG8]